MSLFRALNEAALNANLSKNEAKVFMTLINQTLGYGKSFDHLTHRRLAELAGIRQDRLQIAIEGVVDEGLFTVKKSTYYNFRYQIAPKFLDEDPVFFTPHLPKKRDLPQETDTFSEIKNDPPNFGNRHNNTFTSFNLTSFNLTLPQPVFIEPLVKTSPPPREKITDVVIEPSVETSPPPREKITDVVIEPSVKTSPVSPENVSSVKRILQTTSKKNRAECTQTFSALSVLQQKRVLSVYENKEKTTVIYSPPKLLIALINAERDGRLILPDNSSHASHKPFVTKEKTEQERIAEDHFGKLTWLKNRSESSAVPLPELAEQMLMSAYLDDTRFVKFWLKCHAEQEGVTMNTLAERLMITIDTSTTPELKTQGLES